MRDRGWLERWVKGLRLLGPVRSPAPVTGDNVPFEIDTFTFVGSIDVVNGLTPGPNAGPRTNQLPLIYSVVDFPAAP